MADRGVLIVGTGDEAAAELRARLRSEWRVEFATLDSVRSVRLRSLMDAIDVAVVDARGASASGRARLSAPIRWLAAHGPDVPVLVLADPDDALSAALIGAGAWDVVWDSDPVPLSARLEGAARIRRLRRLAAEEDALEAATPRRSGDEEAAQMIGSSDAIRGVFAMIRRIASVDVPVLLAGESGTGKELAARAIHERSRRASGPFVAINCGAIPETLLESELFGVERGAFTGASQTRKGRCEAAEGGTLFLDEIGDLAPALQVKLLRFLQDHVVERVGGTQGIPVDVRVIAATHRDLPAMVASGAFREDLYFRIAVVTIELPPLRAREEDVVLMARFFLERYRRETQRALRGYTREAIDAMLRHPWPGNVRELINRVRRAAVLAAGPLVGPADLGLGEAAERLRTLSLREARREAEERALRLALERADGNKVEAAHLLGISRTQLYELLARHRGVGRTLPRSPGGPAPRA